MFREPSPSRCDASKNSASIKDSSAPARSSIRRQRPTTSRYGGSDTRAGVFRTQLSRHIEDSERDAPESGRHLRSSVLSRNNGSNGSDLTVGQPDDSRREAGRRILSDVIRRGTPRRLMITRETTLPGSLLNQPSPNNDDSGERQRSPEYPPFTPRFAPAVAYHGGGSPPPLPDIIGLPSSLRLEASGDDLIAARPLLRRVGSRSENRENRHAREPLLDGLGDRQRSLSPDNETNAWDTLLTTITPDPSLPSAASSYGSGSAPVTSDLSRAGAPRSPPTSSQALPNFDSASTTVPVVLDPYPEFLNPCDYPSSDSSSESESDHSHLTRLNRTDRQRLRRARRAQVGSTMGSQPPIPTISVSFSTAIPELQQVQTILERLSHREDIPEDWWAGLSRTVSRRLHPNNDLLHGVDSTGEPVRQRL